MSRSQIREDDFRFVGDSPTKSGSLHGVNSSAQNYFAQYATGLQYANITRKYTQQPNKQYKSFNQITGIESGFRKFKDTQSNVLKQLRQQYQILKTLPIDDRMPLSPKHESSSNSSIKEQDSLSSSKHSKSLKSKRQISSKEAQLLTVEKKQLQIVIGNSMNKIEQLLQNEIQYKKKIHELRLELEGKGTEEKYESLMRTYKKNQAQLSENIQGLKRQIEKMRYVNKQQSDTLSKLQAEMNSKSQENRNLLDQKRKFDDILRIQKDKYSALQLEHKKIKIQLEMTKKDHTSEIFRIKQNMAEKQNSMEKQAHQRLLSVTEELKSKQQRYELLLTQFDRIRDQNKQYRLTLDRERSERERDRIQIQRQFISHFDELKRMVSIYEGEEGLQNQSQMLQLRRIIEGLRQQNRQLKQQIKSLTYAHMQLRKEGASKWQSNQRAQHYMQTIQTLIDKIDKQHALRMKPEIQIRPVIDQNLKNEIQLLRKQINQLKSTPDDEKKIQEQNEIIKDLQRIIDEENQEKYQFKTEIMNIREQFENNKQSLKKYQTLEEQWTRKTESYTSEITSLKNQIEILTTQKGDLSKSQLEEFQIRLKISEAQKFEQQNKRLLRQLDDVRIRARQDQNRYHNQNRNLRRKIDELQLTVERIRKDTAYNINSQKSVFTVERDRMSRQIMIVVNQRNNLKTQNQRIKAFYDAKINDKVRECENIKMNFDRLKIDFERCRGQLLNIQRNAPIQTQQINNLAISNRQQIENMKFFYENKIKDKNFETQDLRMQINRIKTETNMIRKDAQNWRNQYQNLRRQCDNQRRQNQALRADIQKIRIQNQNTIRIECDKVKFYHQELITEKTREISRIKTDLQGMAPFYNQKLVQKDREIERLRKSYEEKFNYLKQMYEGQLEGVKLSIEESNKNRIFQMQQMKKSLMVQSQMKQHQVKASESYLLQLKQQEIIRIRRQYEDKIRIITQEYELELTRILKRLEMLTQANEQFHIQNERYIMMERQLVELRSSNRIVRTQKGIDQGVDHLWKIKETQYSNVDAILKQLHTQ